MRKLTPLPKEPVFEKLTITPLAKKGKSYKELPDLQVMFNPESYSISKSVKWDTPSNSSSGSQTKTQNRLNAPIIAFGGGDSRQLSLELFFDVTQRIDRNGNQIILDDDVRKATNKIVDLTKIQRDEDQPRVCRIFWGDAPDNSDFPFTGVITSLTQKFTQFNRNGNPVRANLTLTFKEFLDPELDRRKTDPELTTHILHGGETLSSISANFYEDPRQWRIIAKSNQIDDPRRLKVGQILSIPKDR
jgi:Contractile injection system tube protein/LysM domain